MIPKFRVYSNQQTSSGKMYFPPVKQKWGFNYKDNYLMFFQNKRWVLGFYTKNDLLAICNHQTGTLMMSTGQKDMDGTEIYEGDIVSYFLGGKSVKVSEDEFIIDDSKPFEDYYINEIVFEGGYFGVRAGETLMPIWNSQNKIKVLGNRYENPELLEDGRNLR